MSRARCAHCRGLGWTPGGIPCGCTPTTDRVICSRCRHLVPIDGHGALQCIELSRDYCEWLEARLALCERRLVVTQLRLGGRGPKVLAKAMREIVRRAEVVHDDQCETRTEQRGAMRVVNMLKTRAREAAETEARGQAQGEARLLIEWASEPIEDDDRRGKCASPTGRTDCGAYMHTVNGVACCLFCDTPIRPEERGRDR